jgi:HK97 family phage prohead protease
MPSEIECRANQSAVECRSGGQRRIGGLAAAFGSPSQMLPGGFVEIVDPQAFSASRETGFRGVIATYEHRDLLASIKGNTLWLDITPRGLDYTAELVASRSDVYELASRGDLSSSFAFISIDDSWSHSEGHPVRTLHSVSLRDVSAVSTPAYLDADVGLRSLANFVHAPYEDVTRYAQTGSLSKFFTRTDRSEVRGWSGKRRTWQQAQTELMAVKYPEDRAKPLTAKQREVELMRVRWPEDRATPLTAKQREVELMRVRWPEDRVTEVMDPSWLD